MDPRHFVTLNERVVFAQFFGLPILYGTFYPIIGDKIAIFWVVIFSLLSFIYFIKLTSLIFGIKSRKYAAVVFLATIPLLYHMNMPYLNMNGGITFFIIGSYYFIKFYQLSKLKECLLASLFFSISIFFRYEFSIFIALFLIITLFIKYKTNLRAYIKPCLINIVIITLLTVIPIFLLNYEVYGNPLKYGMSVLEVYSINREVTPFWKIFLPYQVIPEIITANIYRFFFRMLPLVTLLGIFGVISFLKSRIPNQYILLYSFFLFIY